MAWIAREGCDVPALRVDTELAFRATIPWLQATFEMVPMAEAVLCDDRALIRWGIREAQSGAPTSACRRGRQRMARRRTHSR